MKAPAPTEDDRGDQFVTDADLARFEATAEPLYRSTVEAAKASKFMVSSLGQWIIRLVAEVRRLRRTDAPGPGARLDLAFREDLIEYSKNRIADLWGESVNGVDAEVLARQIVGAQEFMWVARGFPAEPTEVRPGASNLREQALADERRVGLGYAFNRLLSALEARSKGDWCCEVGCGSGACETCPCCSAGWCVSGVDGVPDDPEDRERWLDVAAEHNPVAAALRDAGGVR